MKNVLCYGDSLTWGYNPADGTRYEFDQRWPGILETQMKGQIRVIEEGLPGRTINSNSPFLPGRNGKEALDMVLDTHAPIDIFILMLGTNDLWNGFGYSPEYIASSCMALVLDVQKSRSGPGFSAPEVLLLAPPPFGKLSPSMELYFKGREKDSKEFSELYKVISKTTGAKYLDSSKYVRASAEDGVHFESGDHAKLSAAIKKTITKML